MNGTLRHRLYRRARALAFATAVALAIPGVASAGNYVVLYKQQAVPADAAATIEKAGGRLVARYGAIGVVVARSSDPSFRASLLGDRRIEGAAPTAEFGVPLREDSDARETAGPPPGDLPNAPATDVDTFSPFQWNMQQIHTPEAHAITGGSPSVVVGVIDSGIDARHPDLAANVDAGNSVSCVGGAPNPTPAAWDDDNGHGTFVAGLVAAASNGVGIVGTAPNVKIAAIKAGNAAGFVFPEAAVCAFMWAGSQHLDVTNSSYFVDPFQFNCRNDPVQRAIWKAIHRAVRYAETQGVTVVASVSNSNIDLAHPPQGNECVMLPVEIPGVIGVSAVGSARVKAFYSDYGVGVVDVTAPGGDPLQPAALPYGTILSTYANPAKVPADRRSRVVFAGGAFYRFDFGASFAAPHVSGVAALIVSRYGDLRNPQNGKLRPGRVEALIDQTADPQPCPPEPFVPVVGPPAFPLPLGPFPADCQGGYGYNSFYGHGQVNALRAITHLSANG